MSRILLGRRTSFLRPLRLESLERRELLAGDVTARVVGNTLFVTGNGEDNQVAIAQIENGTYAVVGLGDTTVNGNLFLEDEGNPFITNRPVRNIVVDLGNGDDMLGISNDAAAVYNLALDNYGIDIEGLTGVSADDLDALIEDDTRFDLAGNLTIRTGNGDDAVVIVGNVGGSILANLGSSTVEGANVFAIDGSTLEDGFAQIGGILSVTGGSRTDVVDLADIHARSVVINTGSGDDTVFRHSHDGDGNEIGLSATINTGNGHDYVEVGNTVIGTRVGILTILTGSGDDGVDLFDVEVATTLTINTGSGNDSDEEFEIGAFGEFQGGVVLEEVHVGLLTNINLGSGDDTLDITNSSTRIGLAIGGLGFDRLFVDENTLEAIDLYFRHLQFEDEEVGEDEE